MRFHCDFLLLVVVCCSLSSKTEHLIGNFFRGILIGIAISIFVRVHVRVAVLVHVRVSVTIRVHIGVSIRICVPLTVRVPVPICVPIGVFIPVPIRVRISVAVRTTVPIAVVGSVRSVIGDVIWVVLAELIPRLEDEQRAARGYISPQTYSSILGLMSPETRNFHHLTLLLCVIHRHLHFDSPPPPLFFQVDPRRRQSVDAAAGVYVFFVLMFVFQFFRWVKYPQ